MIQCLREVSVANVIRTRLIKTSDRIPGIGAWPFVEDCVHFPICLCHCEKRSDEAISNY